MPGPPWPPQSPTSLYYYMDWKCGCLKNHIKNQNNKAMGLYGLRDGMLLFGNHWKLWKFPILQIWNKFSEGRKSFSKKLGDHFLVGTTETTTFSYKTALSKTKAIQKVWGGWNAPITKNGVLPITTLFFWKFCFSLRNSYKDLTWCINYPYAHVHTFRKHWSFIWRC